MLLSGTLKTQITTAIMSQFFLHERPGLKTSLEVNSKVFCAPRGLLGFWQCGYIKEICPEPNTYLVDFFAGVFGSDKRRAEKFHASRLAYAIKPSTKIITGLRVISHFLGPQFYAGTIIRADSTTGTHMVLFDNGDLISVTHEDLRVFVQQDVKSPWNLAHPGIREDLQKYLQDDGYRARLMASNKTCIVNELETRRNTKSVTFVEHDCSEPCTLPPGEVDLERYRFTPSILKKYQPLAIPIYFGWQRIGKKIRQNGKNNEKLKGTTITYISPCGRKINSLEELSFHLIKVKSDIPIRYFTFSGVVSPLIRYQEPFLGTHFNDRSFGRENIPVHCSTKNPDAGCLPYFNYLPKSVRSDDIEVDDNTDFVISCDCEDNCQDPSKCSCQILTQTEAKLPIEGERIGYKYQRLFAKVVTGIYECNSKCKCRKTCFNRVVQNPVEIPTEIFLTEKCGWGLRTLVDIPYGTYVCEYVGKIVHPKTSKEFKGDFVRYLADLDYIEIGEQEKTGYENNYGDLENSKENSKEGTENEDEPPKTLRTLLGDEERPYAIDGYLTGNISRFLNHSCAPNLFVQNVFVESHDPRFPHFAFFAANLVEAGEELTFDYGDHFSKEDHECFCKCCLGKGRKRKKKHARK